MLPLVLKNKSRKEWTEMLVLAFMVIILTVSFGYNDTILINRQALSFMGTIFNEDGYGLLRYYDYAHDIVEQQRQAGLLVADTMYDIPIVLIESMWILPLYLFSKTTTADVAATWYGILWGKLFYLIALLISAAIMRRIYLLRYPGAERTRYLILGYLSSVLTCSSIYLIGQCDVIVVCFILASVLEYLKRNTGKFLLLSSIAISLKPFAVFPFLVLTLLRWKSIPRILGNLLAGSVIPVGCKIMFSNQSEATRAASMAFFSDNLKIMLYNKLPVMMGKVPMLVFCVLSCLVIAYLLRESFEILIGMVLSINLLFFSSFWAKPYYYFYMVPFLIMAIEMANNRKGLWLATFGNVSLFFSHILYFHWVYDVKSVNDSLLGNIFGTASTGKMALTLSNIVASRDVSNVIGVLQSLFLACVLGFCLLYFFNIYNKDVMEKDEISTKCYTTANFCQMIVAFSPIVFWFFNRFGHIKL